MPARDVGVLVPAAGSGRRMGGAHKPFLELGGRPVLAWALQPFLDHPAVAEIVVAAPSSVAADPPQWMQSLDRTRVVAGGETRTDSVERAMAALGPEVQRVIVHDGARPLVRREWIDRCLELCHGDQGAIVGYPVSDTIKEVSGDGVVVDTPDRSVLWQVQTPQVFPRDLLRKAYNLRQEGEAPTDDAALVERAGGVVRVVEGAASNMKLTKPEDWALLERWLEGAP